MKVEVSNRTINAITELARYLERDELKHYQEAGCPKKHIWHSVVEVIRWLRTIA